LWIGAAALPFATLGVACVVAGGFVAAVTAPAPSEHGSWTTGYLVLVAGVSQVALGVGQALLAPRASSRRIVAMEFSAWEWRECGGRGCVLLNITTGAGD
jgi:predicted acyltransferase